MSIVDNDPDSAQRDLIAKATHKLGYVMVQCLDLTCDIGVQKKEVK